MNEAVLSYVAGIEPGHRALFDRVHELILATHPDVAIAISYGMPCYRAGRRRLSVGPWAHGVSIYGAQGRDGGFTERHPELRTSKGTIRLRPQEAAAIGDDELAGLINAALGA